LEYCSDCTREVHGKLTSLGSFQADLRELIEFHEGPISDGDHYIPHEDRKREMDDMEQANTRSIRISTRPIKAFLFPSHAAGRKTTGISIRGKRGNVFHLCLRYKTEDEIKEKLMSWGWPSSNDDMPTDADKKKELEQMLTRLYRVTGKKVIGFQVHRENCNPFSTVQVEGIVQP
jgi:hypothetical protein